MLVLCAAAAGCLLLCVVLFLSGPNLRSPFLGLFLGLPPLLFFGRVGPSLLLRLGEVGLSQIDGSRALAADVGLVDFLL